MNRWIELFASHRIAANGAMIIIVAAGLWGMSQVNNQFFPDFEFERINVSASWNGVSAEDMYDVAGVPLQQALLGMPEIESLTTRAREGRVDLSIGISDRAESLSSAADLIETTISGVSLPSDMESPRVSTPQRRESVADILVYGDVERDELAALAYRMQTGLLTAGFAQINLSGLPQQQLEITVDMTALLDTGLTLSQIAAAINNEYTPQPAGTTESNSMTLQLRSQTERINLQSLLDTVIFTWSDGSALRLGDIARVERVISRNSNELYYQGKPAIRLSLLRTAGEDTLENAETMQTWLAEFEPTLPASVQLHVYNETWQIVASQLSMLLKNGALGMALVLISLFFFLNLLSLLTLAISESHSCIGYSSRQG
ncbi:MAG: efflux RND transporter permease subunit [Reinekea sp.]|nr:efflux RND transporter permease subunit [Reinekea sp.]